jgi:hypothetical protein
MYNYKWFCFSSWGIFMRTQKSKQLCGEGQLAACLRKRHVLYCTRANPGAAAQLVLRDLPSWHPSSSFLSCWTGLCDWLTQAGRRFTISAWVRSKKVDEIPSSRVVTRPLFRPQHPFDVALLPSTYSFIFHPRIGHPLSTVASQMCTASRHMLLYFEVASSSSLGLISFSSILPTGRHELFVLLKSGLRWFVGLCWWTNHYYHRHAMKVSFNESLASFASLKRHDWKYCSLFCCERKTLFWLKKRAEKYKW